MSILTTVIGIIISFSAFSAYSSTSVQCYTYDNIILSLLLKNISKFIVQGVSATLQCNLNNNYRIFLMHLYLLFIDYSPQYVGVY